MNKTKEQALAAIKMVKAGAIIKDACEKNSISPSTYAKYRREIAAENGEKRSPSGQYDPKPPPSKPYLTTKGEAEKLKAKGMKYPDIARSLEVSMGAVFTMLTGKDIVKEVERISDEKSITRLEACRQLKVPTAAYTSQKYKAKQKTYGKKNREKNKAKRTPQMIDLVVPTVEQVTAERRASKSNNKVIVFVCNTDDLSSVLKELK